MGLTQFLRTVLWRAVKEADKKEETLIKQLNKFIMEQNGNKPRAIDIKQQTHKANLDTQVLKGKTESLFWRAIYLNDHTLFIHCDFTYDEFLIVSKIIFILIQIKDYVKGTNMFSS